jgi:hypothetical protein
VRYLILCIASYCLIGSSFSSAAVHGGLVCLSCHGGKGGSDGCAVCHPAEKRIFDHAMTTRHGEKAFVGRTYARFDSAFWDKNCTSCHVSRCRDCHPEGEESRKPSVAVCQHCHKGYYTGWDYSGRAPREDNMRYQRGIAVEGETFLKMLSDVHYAKGMSCGACHSMASLMAGKKSSKGCLDCHVASKTVLEHSIAAHLETMECYACHSSWAPQEYGTFFLRFRDQRMKEDFDLKPAASLEYLRSAYLKRQDSPPLGVNSRGMVSPVRPMFIAYYTDIMSARNGGPENTLLAAEWRAYFPHTIQRGSVTCEGCHDNPSRFMMEPEFRRIYNLQKDGMGLQSFWEQRGQRVVNGSFMDASRYRRMAEKSRAYTKGYVEKWKTFLNRVERSSQR